MTREEFERVVSDTIDALPASLRLRLNNVAFVVEEWPDRATLQVAGVHNRTELLGFYQGIPLTERTIDYGLVLPDKITIYRQPILRQAGSDENVRREIRETMLHEIAHYFGIDDDRLEELGAY